MGVSGWVLAGGSWLWMWTISLDHKQNMKFEPCGQVSAPGWHIYGRKTQYMYAKVLLGL